jgi:hypothetical protein
MKMNRITALAVLAIVHAGCSEGDPSPGGAAGGATTSSGTGGGAATSSASSSAGGGGPATCDGEVVHGSGAEITVETVEATVLDMDGAPVAGQLAQVCGLNLCKNVTTGADGHVLVSLGQVMKQPAFKFGDGVDYAKIGRPLSGPSTVFSQVFTPRLPPLDEGAELAAGQDATSAGVTLSIPEGGVIDVDLSFLDDPLKGRFRAAAIPKEKMDPAVVDQGPGLQMFFAFAPLETKLCPAAKVTAPNTAGFPAGAEVEIFVLGLDVGEEWVPYGDWGKVSDGRVSDDGATIASSEGGGLPVLTAMGVRLK